MSLFDSFKKSFVLKTGGVADTVLPELPPGNLKASDPGKIPPALVAVPQVVPVSGATIQPVLFVGGDALWISQVERDLVCLQPGWRVVRAEDCNQALEKCVSASFHAVIFDTQVPEGAKLWKTLEKELANGVCLVRCRGSDRAAAAQWKGSWATLVAEDSDAAALIATVKRLTRIRGWMADSAIKHLVSQIRKLPAQPKLHLDVTKELQSESSSMEVVGGLIAQDPVMAAKILQVVNSAFFGLTREISDTTESVMVLGAERIKALILLAGAFSQYAGTKFPGFSAAPIWGHSVQVGVFARAITLAETKDARLAEAAFTAGLLHDIGKLVLAGNLPEMCETVYRLKASRKITHREAELEILGTSHAELGACLLATWGLPLPILEAIAWHHEPQRSDEKGFSLLAAVHAANVFAQENAGGDTAQDTVNVVYLLQSGLGDCRNRWREYCGLETKPDENVPDEQLRRRREAKEN